jgi:excisionase family DNA binding protein
LLFINLGAILTARGGLNMPEIYKPEEIAKGLRSSRRAVYRWIEQGKLKAFRAGHLVRIKREDLKEFLGGSIPWEEE